MSTIVKICGITKPEIATAMVRAGANYIGLVFHPRSPRFVSDQLGREISLEVARISKRVGLFVDPRDADLEATLDMVPLDMVQLHGRETAERVRDIKRWSGIQIMKSFSIESAADLDAVAEYEDVCDWLLFDAPAPPGSDRSGGNGIAFDWGLLAGRKWKKPWMLAGGLTPDNVAEAIRLTGAKAVDVSSGVESAPGLKNEALAAQFVKATLVA